MINEQLKLFYIKLFIFLFGVFIIFIAFLKITFYAYKWYPLDRQDIANSNIYRAKYSQINSDIIFFGSSRTSLQINPRIIEDMTGLLTFNMGEAGSNIIHTYANVKNYINNNKKPHLIFIEADIMFLDSSILRSRLEKFELGLQDFENSLDWVIYKKKFYRQVKQDFKYLLKKLLSFEKHFFDTRDSIYVNSLNDPAYYIKGSELKLNNKLVISDIQHRGYTIYNDYFWYYEKITELCLENKITTIFISYPRFKAELTLDEQKKMKNYFNLLAEKNNQVFYWDFLNESKFVGNYQDVKHYWYNWGHFNYRGANDFSTYISKKIRVAMSTAK